jgi:hypothetical protein
LSLALVSTCVGAIDWDSIGTDIDNGLEGAISSIGGEADTLLKDIAGDFKAFEGKIESALIGALNNHDGVLDQFTMGHQT